MSGAAAPIATRTASSRVRWVTEYATTAMSVEAAVHDQRHTIGPLIKGPVSKISPASPVFRFEAAKRCS